jgi:hypothetical protein
MIFYSWAIGSRSVDLQSTIQSCLFVHRQQTCVVWRCVGIQWMIRFAFLASQVYQTHVIQTRQTITSFLHLVPSFIQNNRLISSIFPSLCRTIACLLPSLFQSGQSPASFPPFLAQSLFLSWLIFAVTDQCISMSVPSTLFLRIDRSIRLSWTCAIEHQNPKQTSKQNQANL